MLYLKRPFIWIKRFRYRCGYGVHSPFAFDFITTVILEKNIYYAYNEIEKSELYRIRKKNKWQTETKKMNRLLFRIINRIQPEYIFEASQPSVSSLYLQAVSKKCIFIPVVDTCNFPNNVPIFLYIPYNGNTEYVRQIFYKYIENLHNHSVCVVGGIGYSDEMKVLWEELISYSSTGITFDLYDLGIIFFDLTRIKQHYIVNF